MKLYQLGAALIAIGVAALFTASCGSGSSSQDTEEKVHRTSQALTGLSVPGASGGMVLFAGNGQRGAADATVATNGSFNDPAGVAVGPDGSVYVADWGNNSVRKIDTSGHLTTVIAGPPNLLLNPRAEAPSGLGITSWNSIPSPWVALRNQCLTCGEPFDGNYWFCPNSSNADAELYQDVDVSAYASAIDAGTENFCFSALIQSGSSTSTARLILIIIAAMQQGRAPHQKRSILEV